MGELHLRVLLEPHGGAYGVHVKTHTPERSVPRTITRPADGHCRHKKQTGGAGPVRRSVLRVEALGRGAGLSSSTKWWGRHPGSSSCRGERRSPGVVRGAVAGFRCRKSASPFTTANIILLIPRRSRSPRLDARPLEPSASGPDRAGAGDAHESRLPHLKSATSRRFATRRARISGNVLCGPASDAAGLVPLAEISEVPVR